MSTEIPCCCVCGQRLSWVGDELHCPDHYEVNERICDGLNPPGWRDDLVCASDEPPHGFRQTTPAGPKRAQPEPLRSPYWLRSGRHG